MVIISNNTFTTIIMVMPPQQPVFPLVKCDSDRAISIIHPQGFWQCLIFKIQKLEAPRSLVTCLESLGHTWGATPPRILGKAQYSRHCHISYDISILSAVTGPNALYDPKHQRLHLPAVLF